MANSDKFAVRAYLRSEAMTEATFRKAWNVFQEDPFSARRFDGVERTKSEIENGSLSKGYELYRDLSVFLKGRHGLAMLQNGQSKEFALWSYWIAERQMQSAASRERWLAWFGRTFVAAGVVFASGSLESEFGAKHRVDVEYEPGAWRSTDPGWRPHEFGAILPGVYWMTYFGEELTSFFRDRFRLLTECNVTDVPGGGTMVTMDAPIRSEDLEKRLGLQSDLARALGGEFFFDAKKPEAPGKRALAGAFNRSN